MLKRAATELMTLRNRVYGWGSNNTGVAAFGINTEGVLAKTQSLGAEGGNTGGQGMELLNMP